MTEFDQKRRRKIVIIAMICAGVLCLGVLLPLAGFKLDPFMVLCCPAAIVSAGISTNFYWKKLQKRGETKRRGALYGTFIGIISFILMAFIVSTLSSVTGLLQGELNLTGFAILLLTGPLYMSVLGFIFGGFLVIPIGAIAGYIVAKNLGETQLSNPQL